MTFYYHHECHRKRKMSLDDMAQYFLNDFLNLFKWNKTVAEIIVYQKSTNTKDKTSGFGHQNTA